MLSLYNGKCNSLYKNITMNIISFKAEKNYRIAYDSFYYIEDNKKAHKYIERALEDTPEHIKALKLKSALLILEYKLDEALDVLNKLDKITNGDFEIYSKLAYCYLGLQNYKKALEFCEKSALCVNLGDWEKMSVLYKLKIDLYLDMGRTISALKLLRNALKVLRGEYSQVLRMNFSHLHLDTKPSIVEFNETGKAL